ncbi:MAG: hypothetical protein KatS3mg005_0633 [Bryobacteraceae bacterium]|nr:MAG: hypothetical protein KatS3mg005_0633 [Bryobacteraceae bacterium]
MSRLILWLAIFGALLSADAAAGEGAAAEYVGGTLAVIEAGTEGRLSVADPVSLVFETRRSALRIPYERVNLLEYGQQVDRRLLEAILISPMLILSKKRAHFLAIGYQTEDGRQEAVLLKVDKKAIRAVLVSLEARTGLRVNYMDSEARKAGKG